MAKFAHLLKGLTLQTVVETCCIILISFTSVICSENGKSVGVAMLEETSNMTTYKGLIDTNNTTKRNVKLNENSDGAVSKELSDTTNITFSNSGESLQLDEAEFENDIITLNRKDKLFSVDISVFKKYLKDVDWTIIPGLQDDDDFDNWTPPLEIQRDLSMYVSGFDDINQPIWIMEYGKSNIRKYATGPKKLQDLFDKYIRYMAYSALKSHALKSADEFNNGGHRAHRHSVIVDLEGLRLESLTNRQILHFMLRMATNYRRYSEKYLAKLFVINVNSVSEVLLTLARFFIVRIVERMEVYGTNKSIWGPRLLKIFPESQIPEWYGGSKGFKPLYVIG